MSEKLSHIITEDGSSTLYSSRFDQHYHSTHGAIQESMHVFIEAGLNALPQDKRMINVLEMGFGTGLNALLTLLNKGTREIFYTGIEAYPVKGENWTILNYATALNYDYATVFLQQLHESPWDTVIPITKGFLLNKVNCLLKDFSASESYDLLYFDAFGPGSQPELWEESVWPKLYELMNPGGIFVTYSSKGTVRRGLIAAGFEMEKIPGPPGKREMLRGRK